MKICAACHEDLPKDKFSKKQWKLNQRRCKVCVADNREVQQIPSTANKSKTKERTNNNDVVGSLLETMSLHDCNTPITDEDLFKQPTQEDCPICFLRMPSLPTGYKYKVCCGKAICCGCIHAVALRDNDQLCPFCRTPTPTTKEEMIQRTKKRMELKDANAIYSQGCYYTSGMYGLPQNQTKALELWYRAGELGSINAYHNIANAYYFGDGVGVDKTKAYHYWEQAAMIGHVGARHNLGVLEEKAGNFDRALRHYMIARSGHGNSLEEIKQLFMNGHAKKEDYAKALRSYQAYIDEIRSEQRDKTAAFNANWKYY